MDAITYAHAMINNLGEELGPLDHLCFAFPQVMPIGRESCGDPSVYVLGAIVRSRKPEPGQVRGSSGAGHPLPSSYLQVDGIADVEIQVRTNSAKKLLKRKRCLVIEKWGNTFVCRVPNELRDEIGWKTTAVVGVPPQGYTWSLSVVRKLQETCREISRKRRDLENPGISK